MHYYVVQKMERGFRVRETAESAVKLPLSVPGDKILERAMSNKLLPLFVIWLAAKATLYYKIGAGYLEFVYPENDFFPAALAAVNPVFLDAVAIIAFLVGRRWSFAIGLGACFLLVVHPLSFGFQHYVMSLYMFVWLTLKDDNGSVWFGRVTLSFLFMAATIGKLTPGWISGVHYWTYLRHLDQHPTLIIGGEFLFGISFLLPFWIGIALPALIVGGMIISISWLIFDAVGPILGMLLTFCIYHRAQASPATPDWKRPARLVACGLFAAYLTLAALSPRTMYVDRYLLNLPFGQWIWAQILPSMYTTEILITSEGRVTSVPHHPARMFFMQTTAACREDTIEVRYRNEHAARRFTLCNGKLALDGE